MPEIPELEAVLGQRVPGGCDTCDAYQLVTKVDGVYLMNVYHDDDCPVLVD